MNAAHCISGQNKWLEAERFSASLVDACKRAIRLEVKGYRLEAGITRHVRRGLNQL